MASKKLSPPDTADSRLTLGWQVNRADDPQYWLKHGAKIGKHKASDVVEVAASTVGNHTVVVAQSGGGKSFFLGRLVEELLLNTKARCLVLDPNGDFSRANEIADESLWSNAGYNATKATGFLPTEERAVFDGAWANITSNIISKRNRNFQLPWSTVAPDFLNADLNPVLASEVYQCHRFVQEIAGLAIGKVLNEQQKADVLEEAEYWIGRERPALTADQQRALLSQRYPLPLVIEHQVKARIDSARRRFSELFPERSPNDLDTRFVEEIHRPIVEAGVKRAVDAAIRLPRYITDNAVSIYFGRARRFESLFSFAVDADAGDGKAVELARLEVVDLAPIGDAELRRLAVGSILAREGDRLRVAWEEAMESDDQDLRVPTFVIVDEAHNLIPGGDVDRSRGVLREQFRAIAAEGRKFGWVLVLVTQRPDKLDPLVVSECENRAILKIGSQTVLDVTRGMLGLEDVPAKMLERTLDFNPGRVLLHGKWTPNGPVVCYAAARRTREGGRNLRTEHWGRP